jgi:hypothetical protein
MSYGILYFYLHHHRTHYFIVYFSRENSKCLPGILHIYPNHWPFLSARSLPFTFTCSGMKMIHIFLIFDINKNFFREKRSTKWSDKRYKTKKKYILLNLHAYLSSPQSCTVVGDLDWQFFD